MSDDAETKMSFLEHLGELRRRILWSLVAILAGLAIALNFTDRLMKFVRHPFEAAIPGTKLVFLSPTEAFWVYMKVAFIAGGVLAMPVVLYQVWAFIAPGLHAHEKRFAVPFVIIGSLFFLLGATFAQLVVIPFAMRFLVTFPGPDLAPMISVGSYVDFVLKFTLAFGVIFELPLAITLASRMGMVTPQFLARNRKYAILINFVIAAILTPTPDIFNQALMAGPLIVLYEVGIIAARIFGRRRRPATEAVPEAAP
ncbi:MAG: twin-arginine translocase subunit TatC [Candidatus Rokubacteria bacterium]|nr:twin-arginine translocase subunit TatC [Candidatus Rokubacteria bacterium]